MCIDDMYDSFMDFTDLIDIIDEIQPLTYSKLKKRGRSGRNLIMHLNDVTVLCLTSFKEIITLVKGNKPAIYPESFVYVIENTNNIQKELNNNNIIL